MPTIIVVDDEPAICALLIDVLSDEGYLVYSAADGNQALPLIAAHQTDLILTDVMMPVLDGIELCHRLQSNPFTVQIPIILFSAGREDVVQDRCHYVAFLRKPFDLNQLTQLVASTLAVPRSAAKANLGIE